MSWSARRRPGTNRRIWPKHSHTGSTPSARKKTSIGGSTTPPVLDGFDELPQQYHRDAVHEISSFSGALVVTSRPHEYTQAAAQTRALSRAAAIELDDLTPDESRTYLRTSTRKTRTAEWDAVFQQLRNAPDATASQNLLPVLTTPLMVTLARAIYNDIPDHHPGELLDTRRFPTRDHLEEHLLGAYLDTIYDPRNDTAPPTGPPPPTWTPHRARRWLGYLATHLTEHDTHDLTWWQLPNTLHRHTRILLMMAPGLAIVLAFVLMDRLGGEVSAFGFLAMFVIMSAGGLAVGLVNEMSFAREHTGREPSRLQLRLRRRGRSKTSVRSNFMKAASEAINGIAIGLVIGLAIGLEEGLWYVLLATEPDRFWYGFAGGIEIGFALGLAIGLSNIIVAALSDTNEERYARPARSTSSDTRNSETTSPANTAPDPAGAEPAHQQDLSSRCRAQSGPRR